MSIERQHERYEELAAMAAIGELGAVEFEELREHFACCGSCRTAYGDFARIASTDLGLLAIKSGGPICASGPEKLDEAGLLASIRAKASVAEPRVVEYQHRSVNQNRTFFFWTGLRQRLPMIGYALASVMVALGLFSFGYWVEREHSQPAFGRYEAELARLRENSEAAVSGRNFSDEALRGTKVQVHELTRKLEEADARQARLVQERDGLQEKLNSVEMIAEAIQNDLKVSESRREVEARVRSQLQQQLLDAKDRIDEQSQTVSDLRAKLEKTPMSKPAVEVAGMSAKDEARQLFGARDLHIVDVYDVDDNGKTKRTYGRVYYVEKKLLVFYAFDLQGKKKKHDAIGFQAWGYRETGENKPENLGLFHLDDASANRWILQVNNPHVLERIDAVYVTAEPMDGSPSPQGRRLLYANLISPPNHP